MGLILEFSSTMSLQLLPGPGIENSLFTLEAPSTISNYLSTILRRE